MKELKKIIVHGGIFHADDVLVVAMLRELFPQLEIIRTSDKNVFADYVNNVIGKDDVVVADVGGGHYDHHQNRDAEYAACGLVFNDICGKLFPTPESIDRFRKGYIIPVEKADNGIIGNPLSLAVNSFRPNWDDEKSMDETFLEAIDFVQTILKKEIAKAVSEYKAESVVEDAFAKAEDKRIIVLPEFVPWQAVLCEKSAPLFVIFKSLRGGYSIQSIPVKAGSFDKRMDIPVEWLDQKPDGCTFVHPNLFLASFDTVNQAYTAAKKYMDNREE